MRKGEVCGACTGALMVLGSLYGQYDKSDTNSRLVTNDVNDKMMERFATMCGSYLCNDLLKCDISTEEGVEYAIDNNLFPFSHEIDLWNPLEMQRKNSRLRIRFSNEKWLFSNAFSQEGPMDCDNTNVCRSPPELIIVKSGFYRF